MTWPIYSNHIKLWKEKNNGVTHTTPPGERAPNSTLLTDVASHTPPYLVRERPTQLYLINVVSHTPPHLVSLNSPSERSGMSVLKLPALSSQPSECMIYRIISSSQTCNILVGYHVMLRLAFPWGCPRPDQQCAPREQETSLQH